MVKQFKSLYHPDYKYKRFPCNYDGYLSAHSWVIKIAEDMLYNRLATVSINSFTEAKYLDVMIGQKKIR